MYERELYYEDDDEYEVDPILTAVDRQNEEEIKELLKDRIDSNSLCDEVLRTASNGAATCRIIQLFVDRVDPRVSIDSQQVVLDLVVCALENGHCAAARRLVKRWAPLPALHKAALFGDNDTVVRLVKNETDVDEAVFERLWTAIHVAASCGLTDTVTVLRDSGADMNAKDKWSRTPAHLAARNGHTHTVASLSDRGANLNAEDIFQQTPAHRAAGYGHTDTVAFLCDSGANMNATDAQGNTSVHIAAENGHTDTVAFLCDSGANMNATNTRGYTSVHMAAENGHTDTVAFLRDSGANMNATDTQGNTLVHIAAGYGHTDTVAFLRDSGANMNATNTQGNTLVHMAAEDGHTDTVAFLRDSGADVNAKNLEGKTPSDMAAEKRHTDTVRFLKCSGGAVTTKGDLRCGSRFRGVSQVVETDRFQLLLDDWTAASRELRVKSSAMSASSEEALLKVLSDVGAAMGGPGGWAAPPQTDVAASALRRLDEFHTCREKLSTILNPAEQRHGCWVRPEEVAQCRANCCAAAEALLDLLPPMAAAAPDTEPVCVRGIAAARQYPPPQLVRELTAAAAAAKEAHERGAKTVARAASQGRCPLASAMEAALHANESFGEHVEVLREKLREARRATIAAPAPHLTAVECGHHRAAADAVLASEKPWAGAAGLERRAAALACVAEAIASREREQRVVDRAARAIARANLDLEDATADGADSAAQSATARLHDARALRDAALPALLTATAVVQKWATSGEGALALQAFPRDEALTAMRSTLCQSEFMAVTELPQTPGVVIDDEYAGGLTKTAASCLFFARRRAPEHSGAAAACAPIVLRRLRLDTPTLVEDARRQLRDAGRIAVGLRACPDAAAGCPSIVKATRWFVAKGPEGGAADAWLEFPRAEFGSLAEVEERGAHFSAVAGRELCLRLVRAVAQLHAAGIRHGDLNPNNVVLWDDPTSDLVRPGIIDLLDTVVVGATQTLRGATLGWLPPEATGALGKGATAYATRELDCWQLGRICLRVLDLSALPSDAVRAAAAQLCVEDPAARSSAAAALREMESATSGATAAATATSKCLEWALPPTLWHCRRGAARGVDFVKLDPATDPAARALTACAAAVGRAVGAVYRLENVRLWRVYAAERARVQ